MFFRLSYVDSLGFARNQVEIISNDAFNGLTQLNSLNLGYNRLSTLNDGAFNGLTQLHYLYLYRNRLSTLSNGVFNGLTELNYLALWGNQLSTFSEGVFNELIQLRDLNLLNNQLSILSDGLFDRLSQLNSLILSGNQLSIFSNGAFNKLTQLHYLSLYYNRLNTLSNDVFNGLTQLNNLYLQSNQLSTLNDGLFSKLTQLNVLDLSFNQLNDTAIKNLTRNFPFQLNRLSLRYNQIGNEGALALAEILPCTNLTDVDFDDNLANDMSIILATQEKALRKVCDDRRCHANLPASQSCSVPQNSVGLSQMLWGAGSSIGVIDEDRLADMNPSTTHYFSGFFSSHSLTRFSLPELPSPGSFSTSSTARVITVGVVGFALLLYKNATIMRNVFNLSCRLLQNYFYRTRDNLKPLLIFIRFIRLLKLKREQHHPRVYARRLHQVFTNTYQE